MSVDNISRNVEDHFYFLKFLGKASEGNENGLIENFVVVYF